MKKRKMMALLTAAAVMCSLAVPALADEAEGDLIPITFCRTADPVFCKTFLHKIAKTFCRSLQLHFVGNCKPGWQSWYLPAI